VAERLPPDAERSTFVSDEGVVANGVLIGILVVGYSLVPGIGASERRGRSVIPRFPELDIAANVAIG